MNLEFTSEQQEYIDKLILEKTSGLFTKEDLEKEITREVDRRVESGIQKGIETQKSKWEKEFEEKSKLTAEELAQSQLNLKLTEIESREKELNMKANTLNAQSMLANANIPKEHYDKFIGILVNGDEDATKLNVQNFIDTFNETRISIEKSIQEKYSTIPSPTSGKSDAGQISKSDFDKLSYDEKLKLKSEQPEIFKQFIG